MSDVNLHVALLWALVGQWFCMAAKLESRQSLTLGDVSLFGPNTKLLGLYVMKSAQTHFMSPSQQRGFILMECWKRWRGDITLTLTNGRAQLHSCSTYQREGRRVSFVRVWGLYCIQTTGSFSVAPPSLESDLMVLEPKIGFWNMFHSAYCLQVDYAVTRIVGSFLWIEIQKKNMFYILQTVCPEEMWSNVASLSLIYSILLPVQTLCDEFSPSHGRWDKFFVEFVTAHRKCQPFTIPFCLSRKWQANEGSSAGGHGEPGSDHRASERVQHDPRRLLHGPHWHRHESQGGVLRLLSCSICFKIEFPNTSITARLNQKV